MEKYKWAIKHIKVQIYFYLIIYVWTLIKALYQTVSLAKLILQKGHSRLQKLIQNSLVLSHILCFSLVRFIEHPWKFKDLRLPWTVTLQMRSMTTTSLAEGDFNNVILHILTMWYYSIKVFRASFFTSSH